MAETFKSINADLGTSADTSIYQCPASTTAIVILCQVANVDGTNSADMYLDYYDSSTTTAKALAHTVAVPADSAFISSTPTISLSLTSYVAPIVVVSVSTSAAVVAVCTS